jgi:hypothetical protein
VNRAVYAAQKHAEAAGVIAVFVSDENGIKLLVVDAYECQPPKYLARTESGVDQNIRGFG